MAEMIAYDKTLDVGNGGGSVAINLADMPSAGLD